MRPQLLPIRTMKCGFSRLCPRCQRGKTVIMIAHRLSSVTGADCIYVLQDGVIVESGTHSGLIEQNGIFAQMWKAYSEAAEWKIEKEARV